jgi:hypothetical protein
MSEIMDFGDSNINSTIIYYFIRKKLRAGADRLRFELKTLGYDFCIIIFSVLAMTATRLLELDVVLI